MMLKLLPLFPSSIYRNRLAGGAAGNTLVHELARSCRSIAADDMAGQAWCRKHHYHGYTSYASLADLPWRDPVIADLVKRLDKHVARFAEHLEFDLAGRALELDSLWINILEPGGQHSAHIHPNSVVSGTYYVALPKGAAGITFEDPRLAQMMAAPRRRADARPENRTFAELVPEPGTVLLWESFLRHAVPVTRGRGERISISFNYRMN
jgi:uncharacterized protein (TIGR02466 family)